MTNTRRNESIDIARTIAMGLVVYEHLLRCYSESLVSIVENTLMAPLIHILTFYHMPVFFVLAGYCMAISRRNVETLGDYRRFEWRKFQRLVIPYLFVCVLQLAAAIAVGARAFGDIPSEAYKAIVTPVYGPAGHGWFLMALMSIFLLWHPLNWLFRKEAVLIFVILAFLEIYKRAFTTNFNADFLQLDTILRYLPLFAFGVLIAGIEPRALFTAKPIYFVFLLAASILLTALCVSLKQTSLLENNSFRPLIYDSAGLAGRICGGASVIRLSAFIEKLLPAAGKCLAHIGLYSYDIYLYHILTIMAFVTFIAEVPLKIEHILSQVSLQQVFMNICSENCRH